MTTMGIEPKTSGLEVHTFTTELPSPDRIDLLLAKSECGTLSVYIHIHMHHATIAILYVYSIKLLIVHLLIT